MFFPRSFHRIAGLSVMALGPCLVGCEMENTVTVHCQLRDCAAACETLGFEDGLCVESDCTCVSSTDTSPPFVANTVSTDDGGPDGGQKMGGR